MTEDEVVESILKKRDEALHELQKQQDEAMEEARTARNQLSIAKKRYASAIVRAKQLDIPNMRIARALGVSETAVRLFYKRWTERKDDVRGL